MAPREALIAGDDIIVARIEQRIIEINANVIVDAELHFFDLSSC